MYKNIRIVHSTRGDVALSNQRRVAMARRCIHPAEILLSKIPCTFRAPTAIIILLGSVYN